MIHKHSEFRGDFLTDLIVYKNNKLLNSHMQPNLQRIKKITIESKRDNYRILDQHFKDFLVELDFSFSNPV